MRKIYTIKHKTLLAEFPGGYLYANKNQIGDLLPSRAIKIWDRLVFKFDDNNFDLLVYDKGLTS